jgi:hypothetical protein
MNNSLGGPVDLGRLRVPGVLQRFAITYLAVGTAGLLLTPADLSAPHPSVFNFTFHFPFHSSVQPNSFSFGNVMLPE